jgi:uncharacterized membrane protein YqjE
MAEETRQERTAELVREAIDETRELGRLEVQLAKEELLSELRQAKAGGITIGVGAAVALMGVTLFFVAIAMAFDKEAVAALAVGGMLLVLGALLALVGTRVLPGRPLLGETKERLQTDLKQLKERVA